MLGKGAFGKVNLGMHKLARKLVAIKSKNKQYLKDERSKKKVTQEVAILKRTRHPNVVKYECRANLQALRDVRIKQTHPVRDGDVRGWRPVELRAQTAQA